MKSDISHIIHHFTDQSRDILRDNLVSQYLFGSYARETQTSLSDIDILIIVKNLTPDMQARLSGLASEYALDHGICISPILTDMSIWKKNKEFDTLFYQEIKRNGIRL